MIDTEKMIVSYQDLKERNVELEDNLSNARTNVEIQRKAADDLEAERDRLRDALLNLNAAIDYHWNDSFTGVQRMPYAHAKMIVAAQQVAKKAIRKEIT